jgi:hypothetical protein
VTTPSQAEDSSEGGFVDSFIYSCDDADDMVKNLFPNGAIFVWGGLHAAAHRLHLELLAVSVSFQFPL